MSAALARPVQTACDFVAQQSVHHVDETVWPEGEKLKWLWIHATPQVTVFTIRPGRTKQAAQEILGRNFTGIVNTDRYNAYHWVDADKRQLCWAHLKREFQAIKERGGSSTEIGEGLLTEVSKLFEHWYELREDQIDWPTLLKKRENQHLSKFIHFNFEPRSCSSSSASIPTQPIQQSRECRHAPP